MQFHNYVMLFWNYIAWFFNYAVVLELHQVVLKLNCAAFGVTLYGFAAASCVDSITHYVAT